MGFLDGLRRSTRPEDEEYYDDYEDDYGYEEDEPEEQEWESEKVHRIHTKNDLQVVLVRPERYEDASDIADHLRDLRVIILNLEETAPNVARRLLDFLSGVTYAEDGNIRKIAFKTYLIAPYCVDILGNLAEEGAEQSEIF